MNEQYDYDRCNAHPMPSRASRPQHSDPAPAPGVPRPLCHQRTGPDMLCCYHGCSGQEPKDDRTFEGRKSLSRRSHTGSPTPFAVGASVLFLCICSLMIAPANATAAPTKPTFPRTALGGFVKDSALARILGETLF